MTGGGLAERWDLTSPVFGGWTMSGSALAAEILATGLDYVVVDCQHGLIGYDRMVEVLGTCRHLPLRTLVRVPSAEASWIGRALDAGADGIVVPLVESAAEAARAAEECRYPPRGRRSYGPVRTSPRFGRDLTCANQGVTCFVMVETARGLANVDAIARTPGVDGVYAGPADIALSVRGELATSVRALTPELSAIRDACCGAGIVAAAHATSAEEALELAGMGFRMVSAVTDVAVLRAGVLTELERLRHGLLRDVGEAPST